MTHRSAVPISVAQRHARRGLRWGPEPVRSSRLSSDQDRYCGLVSELPDDAPCGDVADQVSMSGSAGVDGALQAAIDLGYERRDRQNMDPTITYFHELLEKHPGNAVVLYEVAGAHDTAGEEQTALGYYERALSAGLAGDVLRRCLCQYASTNSSPSSLITTTPTSDDGERACAGSPPG